MSGVPPVLVREAALAHLRHGPAGPSRPLAVLLHGIGGGREGWATTGEAATVRLDRADLVATLRWGYEWDIGAAALIAREAGAAVSDAFGQPLNYNKRDPRDFGVLVSAPDIHAAAVERLADRAKALAG